MRDDFLDEMISNVVLCAFGNSESFYQLEDWRKSHSRYIYLCEAIHKYLSEQVLEERNACALIAQRKAEYFAELGEHGNESLVANDIAKTICARTPND